MLQLRIMLSSRGKIGRIKGRGVISWSCWGVAGDDLGLEQARRIWKVEQEWEREAWLQKAKKV